MVSVLSEMYHAMTSCQNGGRVALLSRGNLSSYLLVKFGPFHKGPRKRHQTDELRPRSKPQDEGIFLKIVIIKYCYN